MENIGDQAHVSIPPPQAESFELSGLQGISEEDKEDIIQQIDRVVEENKIPVTEDLFTLAPEKHGFVLPLFINLFALLLIAGGIFGAMRYFDQKQQNLNLETQAYLSAEGKLIEELQKESRQKLQAKEEEISSIQQELSLLERQRQELQESMESRIQNREEELRLALQDELEAERQRLQEQGISQADIESRLEDLEEQRQLEYEAELNQFKSEARAAIQEKEEELVKAKQLTEEILTKAKKEKEEIIATREKQEAELKAQFEEEKAALESRSTEAEARLKELAAQREQEQLVNDQILGAYNAVITKIEKGDTPGALQEIQDLKAIFQDKAVLKLPAIAKRKDIELFLIENLEDTLQETPSEAESTPSSIVDAANMLLGARELITRADQEREGGNLEDAARLYQKALAGIPSVSQAYSSLSALENQERKEEMESIIRRAEGYAGEGDIEQAVQTYKEAAVAGAGAQEPLTEAAVEQIAGLLREREQTALAVKDEQIAELQQTIETRESRIAELQQAIRNGEDAIEGLNTQLAQLKTELIDAEDTNTDLNEEIEEKDSSITELQDNISTLETRVSSLQTEMETLKEENQETIAQYEERLASLQESSTTDLSDKDERISELRRALTQLEEENSELLASLETTKERLAKEEEARETAEQERLASEEARQKLEEEKLAALEARDKAEEARLTALEEKAAAEKSLSEAEQARLSAENAREEAVKEKEEALSSSREAKEALAAANEGTGGEGPRGGNGAESSSAEPEEKELSQETAGVYIAEGREEALKDIISYVGYLDKVGKEGLSVMPATTSRKAEEEPLFAAAVNSIKSLAFSGEAETKVVRTQLKLVGTVSSVTSEKLIVEPLVRVNVNEGDTLWIKRKSSGLGGEQSVAKGTVDDVKSGRIVASISSSDLGSSSPLVMDLVYTEIVLE